MRGSVSILCWTGVVLTLALPPPTLLRPSYQARQHYKNEPSYLRPEADPPPHPPTHPPTHRARIDIEPPHRTTQRWPLSVHVTLIPGYQPSESHWKQVWLQVSVHVRSHVVSFTPSITNGVPRRSITASPCVDPPRMQSPAMPSSAVACPGTTSQINPEPVVPS